jgi:hypothetical protein
MCLLATSSIYGKILLTHRKEEGAQWCPGNPLGFLDSSIHAFYKIFNPRFHFFVSTTLPICKSDAIYCLPPSCACRYPLPWQEQARQPRFAFRRDVPEGIFVSSSGLAVSRVGTANQWQGAVVEPAVSSAERCYAEWVIEEADADCSIMLGVTDIYAAPPAGQRMFSKPGSSFYNCCNARAYPGGRIWGAAGKRARGDRVGLLVERGSVSVYVNRVRLGPGPMATDLPQRVSARTHCKPAPTPPKPRRSLSRAQVHCASPHLRFA